MTTIWSQMQEYLSTTFFVFLSFPNNQSSSYIACPSPITITSSTNGMGALHFQTHFFTHGLPSLPNPILNQLNSLSFHISKKKKVCSVFTLCPLFCWGITRIYIQITLSMNHKLANRPSVTYRRDIEILRPFFLHVRTGKCRRSQSLLSFVHQFALRYA